MAKNKEETKKHDWSQGLAFALSIIVIIMSWNKIASGNAIWFDILMFGLSSAYVIWKSIVNIK